MTAYRTEHIWLLFGTGVLAGVANGLIGCGGGIFIVWVLTYLCRESGEFSDKDVFATAVASVLPMSAVSAVLYSASGVSANAGELYGYLLPAVVGGALGALFLDRIGSRALKRIFSLLVMWAGLSMILRRAGVML